MLLETATLDQVIYHKYLSAIRKNSSSLNITLQVGRLTRLTAGLHIKRLIRMKFWPRSSWGWIALR